MKPDTGAHINGFDRDMSEDEVLGHLTELRHRTSLHMPILDDDDYEAAIEEAARAITAPPRA
ncbi:hypothetical protein ACIRST_41985 [Kitasatospora sp. NPDC101447]|uniref:hypothetical protein n=1 Tax=Kitasatospora sp. NPDC101447 TaxID=3364102 RepID=UPI0038306829